MRVLFLDIDGVLNTDDLIEREKNSMCISGTMLLYLKEIVQKTDAKIVLHSTWKNYPEYVEYTRKRLAEHDLEIFDIAHQVKLSPSKAIDIREWLEDRYGIDNWVVIDDDELYVENFIKIDSKTGLTPKAVAEVVEFFNSE
jgi:hypothetical protein